MMIRAVFFDAVGTLIHPDPPAATVYAEVARRYGSRLTHAEIAARFRQAFARQEQIDRIAGWRTDEAREVERWRQIIAAVLTNVSEPAACFAELFEHFGRPGAWRCEPDTRPTLQELKKRGYHLGLASNYDQRLRPVAASLLPSLGPILISSEVGWRKPAAEFFAAMCRSVALPPEQVLYVGDDLVNDYEGARSAGLAAVWFAPSCRHDRGIPAVARLADLLN